MCSVTARNPCSFEDYMKPILLSFFPLLVAATVLAQSTPPRPISTNPVVTLERLTADVLEKNPELNFYQAEISAAKGERTTAGALANPELSTTIADKRVTGASLAGEGTAWSASVRQTFEWPGRISLRKAIANREIKLAELGYDQFKAALQARARSLAFHVVAAQEESLAAQEVASRFQTLQQVLVQRDPAGLTPMLELRIIEATALYMRRKVSEARQSQQNSLTELNQLRGAPLEEQISMDVRQLLFAPLPDNQTLLLAAETNNFVLKIRQMELEQQGFKLSLARNERFPPVSVGPFISQERAGDREQQLGVGLSVPLPLWNRNSGRIATEAARRDQAETSYQVSRLTVQRKVLENATAYRNRTSEMSDWRSDSIKQFQEAAALADEHYRLGAVPIATYVELQKQYLEAIETLMSTRNDALEAQLQLEQLLGMPIQELSANASLRGK